MSEKIMRLSLDKLKPYKNNAKIHPESQIKKLVSAIERNGFRRPIEVDENFVILTWHGRYIAAERMKLKDVPVIQYTDMDEKQKKQYRLDDNALSDLGDYDIEIIQSELESIWMDSYNEDLYAFALPDLSDMDWDIDFDNIKSNENREVSDKTKEVECPNCQEKFSI